MTVLFVIILLPLISGILKLAYELTSAFFAIDDDLRVSVPKVILFFIDFLLFLCSPFFYLFVVGYSLARKILSVLSDEGV